MELSSIPMVLANPESAMSHVRIEGSTELAQCISYLFNTLKWDPEDDLAAVLGDKNAVYLMQAFRQLAQTSSSQAHRAVDTLREYVVYEKGVLAEQSQFDGFVANIKTLRDDVSRLEKRLQLLQTASKTGKST